MHCIVSRTASWLVILFLPVQLTGCGGPDPITADRYAAPDRLFSVLRDNVSASADLELIVSIDHSRLGSEAGSVMPPARVLIFSNPVLESHLVSINPLTAIDLPLRVLAYESVATNSPMIASDRRFASMRSRKLYTQHPEASYRCNLDCPGERTTSIDDMAPVPFSWPWSH